MSNRAVIGQGIMKKTEKTKEKRGNPTVKGAVSLGQVWIYLKTDPRHFLGE